MGNNPAETQQSREMLLALRSLTLSDPEMKGELDKAWDMFAQDMGRSLTDEEKSFRDEGLPPIAGGADVPPQGPEGSEDSADRPSGSERGIPNGSQNEDKNNRATHGVGRFADFVDQALTAGSAGSMANSFLESIVEQAIKRANAMETEVWRREAGIEDIEDEANRVELQRIKQEYEAAIKSINEVYRRANPGRQQQEKEIYNQAASDFVSLVKQAAQLSGGKMSEATIPAEMVEYLEKGVDMGDTVHIAIGRWLTDEGSHEEVMHLMTDKTRRVIFEQLW